MTGLTLPKSVTTYQGSAFSNCTALKKIMLLNPQCEMNGVPDGITICGYTNSTAHDYATKWGYSFVALDAQGNTSTSGTVKSKSITSLKGTLSKASYVYSGSAYKPTVTIKDGSTTLKRGTDYTVTYSNNKNVGKATVKLIGKGNYSGTKLLSFKINPKKPTMKSVTAAKKVITKK